MRRVLRVVRAVLYHLLSRGLTLLRILFCRRYATAGAAAASSTQQYTVGQTPKPRRKWPAPEQGPVVIEISDDEVDEYDEGR